MNGIVIDSSLVDFILSYIRGPSDALFDSVVDHPAARKTYSHAKRFNNTDLNRIAFWKGILEKEQSRNASYSKQVARNLEYIKNNQDMFNDAFDELAAYIPSDYVFECRLFLTLGYDIGIVSEGDALLNIGHKHFSMNPSEMLYYSMHELHHVCYTNYHPIFTFSDLKTNRDLFDVLLYSTHLEGMAVYCPLKRRLFEHNLNDEDYRVLLDPNECLSRVQEFFKIYNDLRTAQVRPLVEEDFEILEVMSGPSKRLWYITGAYIAQVIDSHLGREKLVNTIVEGPKSFFTAYEEAISSTS